MNEDKIAAIVIAVFLPILACLSVLALYGIFYIAPIQAMAAKDCLERGFPKVHVTYNGDAYCVGYDGAVYPRIEKR